jgi:hypothetical protein
MKTAKDVIKQKFDQGLAITKGELALSYGWSVDMFRYKVRKLPGWQDSRNKFLSMNELDLIFSEYGNPFERIKQ